MEKEAIVIEQTYLATISMVWKAITNKDEMKRWYFDLPDFLPEVGFEFRFMGGPVEDRQYLHICMLMANDSLESLGQKLVPGNNHYLCISPDSKEEANEIYTKLSVNGKIEMPIQDTFWGAYYGAFADLFGIQWMISYDYPKA